MKHPYFNQYKFKYLEWNDAALLYETTKMWQSQLAFIKGEQSFLKELLAENTLKLLAESCFEMAKHLSTDLVKLSDELPEMLVKIKKHRNDIVELIDSKDEFFKERTFQDAHLLLEMSIGSYLEKYHNLKDEIFTTMQEVFKKSKNHSLLTP